MCFLLNPPAPHCICGCGACACVPKYWELVTDAYTETDPDTGDPVAVHPELTLILKYKEPGFSGFGSGFPFPVGKEKCWWGFDSSDATDEQKAHPLFDPWYLYFDDDVWRIRHYSGDADSFQEWSLSPPSDHPNPVTPDPARSFLHFACLEPNRFYFLSSTFSHSGTPSEIEITPFYP